MAESGLSLGWADIKAEVGFYLGWGRDAANWSADKVATIESIVHSGFRQFYFPPLLEGRRSVHEWSFLYPTATLDTAADDEDQDLPDGFGSIRGDFTFASGVASISIPVVAEEQIRVLRQTSIASTRPWFAAIRPKAGTGVTGQRYEVMWFPTPDAVYTLSYPYLVLLDKLETALPYGYGGMQHAETQLQSCLAVAEFRLNDAKGIHWDQFMERLATSVAVDEQQGPHTLGYNGDAGDGSEALRITRATTVTYNAAP